jgi:hypothetical protein
MEALAGVALVVVGEEEDRHLPPLPPLQGEGMGVAEAEEMIQILREVMLKLYGI